MGCSVSKASSLASCTPQGEITETLTSGLDGPQLHLQPTATTVVEEVHATAAVNEGVPASPLFMHAVSPLSLASNIHAQTSDSYAASDLEEVHSGIVPAAAVHRNQIVKTPAAVSFDSNDDCQGGPARLAGGDSDRRSAILAAVSPAPPGLPLWVEVCAQAHDNTLVSGSETNNTAPRTVETQQEITDPFGLPLRTARSRGSLIIPILTTDNAAVIIKKDMPLPSTPLAGAKIPPNASFEDEQQQQPSIKSGSLSRSTLLDALRRASTAQTTTTTTKMTGSDPTLVPSMWGSWSTRGGDVNAAVPALTPEVLG